MRDAKKISKKRRDQGKGTALGTVEILELSWSEWKIECVVKYRSQACKDKWGPYAECYSSDEKSHI